MEQAPASDRVKVRRLPTRGHYDDQTIREILAEGRLAHVGVQTADGPLVLPMAYGVGDDDLYLHGAVANALLKEGDATEVCVTVTLLDGLVLARSAFHHSMNYRSVVIRGLARKVTDADEKWRSVQIITDQVQPGRWDDCRQPDDSEMRATLVLAVPLTEASAKVRTGPPNDDDVDMGLGFWAGVVPLGEVVGDPEPAPDLEPGVDLPSYLS